MSARAQSSAAVKEGSSTADVQAALLRALEALPPLHFFSLWYIMRLLHRLCKHEGTTKMGAAQFGVCFGPTLLRARRPEQEAMDVAMGFNAKVLPAHTACSGTPAWSVGLKIFVFWMGVQTVEQLILLPKRAWQQLQGEVSSSCESWWGERGKATRKAGYAGRPTEWMSFCPAVPGAESAGFQYQPCAAEEGLACAPERPVVGMPCDADKVLRVCQQR